MRLLGAALLAATLLTGCMSGAELDASLDGGEKSGKQAEGDADQYADKVKATLHTELGGKVNRSCDHSDPTWHCYYDDITSPREGRADVHLSFSGDVTEDERQQHAETARVNVFNLTGLTLEDLDTVVAFDNGVDAGTTRRDEVPLLN